MIHTVHKRYKNTINSVYISFCSKILFSGTLLVQKTRDIMLKDKRTRAKEMKTFTFLLTDELFERIKETGHKYQRKPGQEIRFVLEKLYNKEDGQKETV
jgi:hypothetical protein